MGVSGGSVARNTHNPLLSQNEVILYVFIRPQEYDQDDLN
jgi:hypothetical protein